MRNIWKNFARRALAGVCVGAALSAWTCAKAQENAMTITRLLGIFHVQGLSIPTLAVTLVS